MTPLAAFLLITTPARAGDLTLVMHGEDARFVELACRSGHRERQRPRPAGPGAASQVKFEDVPDDECVVHFKGTTPRRYGPLPGHGTLECRLDGRLARCAPPDGRPAPADATAPRPGPAAPAPAPAPSAPAGIGAPAPAAPAARDGALELSLVDAPGVFGYELSCRSGHRARTRRPTDGTAARFDTVPGDDCRVHFRGSPPAIIHTVQPGSRLRCEIRGVTALCTAEALGD